MEEKKSLRQRILKFIKDNYIMSPDDKKLLIDRNLHGIMNIITILLFYGIIMSVYILIKRRGEYRENILEIVYYLLITFFSLQNEIYIILAKKHKEWDPVRRNQGLFMSFFLFLGLFTYTFYFGTHQFNSFVLFAITAVITITFFTIEPFYYSGILIVFGIFFIVHSFKVESFRTAFDIFLFCFALVFFSMVKWKSTIRNQKYEKKLKQQAINMEKEIMLASHVQESFYKKDLSGLNNYEIKVYSKAMAGVSGDLYDFYTRNHKLDGFGLFDISGHGLASGLVTMLVRNIINQEFYNNKEIRLEDVALKIDDRIKKEKGDIQNYMTGIIVRINDEKPDFNMEIVNAGHQNPVIYRKSDNSIFFLDEKKTCRSSVIGLDSIDSYFDTIDFKMEPGDEMILYTDGITEAINQNREQFGKERLMENIKRMIRSAEEDIEVQEQILLDALKSFTGTEPAVDDVTLIIIKRK